MTVVMFTQHVENCLLIYAFKNLWISEHVAHTVLNIGDTDMKTSLHPGWGKEIIHTHKNGKIISGCVKCQEDLAVGCGVQEETA